MGVITHGINRECKTDDESDHDAATDSCDLFGDIGRWHIDFDPLLGRVTLHRYARRVRRYD